MNEVKFSVGDKVRFLVENFDGDINSDMSYEYQICIDKVGTVVAVDATNPYPYDADFNGEPILFVGRELELAE